MCHQQILYILSGIIPLMFEMLAFHWSIDVIKTTIIHSGDTAIHMCYCSALFYLLKITNYLLAVFMLLK